MYIIVTGFITISDWCYAMEETTHLGLPWRMLKDKLVRTDTETRHVRYMDTFDLTANVSYIGNFYFQHHAVSRRLREPSVKTLRSSLYAKKLEHILEYTILSNFLAFSLNKLVLIKF